MGEDGKNQSHFFSRLTIKTSTNFNNYNFYNLAFWYKPIDDKGIGPYTHNFFLFKVQTKTFK